MKPATSIPATGAALVLALLCQSPADAQFGFPGLPRGDFTWIWGDQRRAAEGRAPDLRMTGYDSGFECDLTGRLRPGSTMSRMDVRQIENEIRTSLSFIEATAYMMNTLEFRRDLDWAKLDCVQSASDRDTVVTPAPEAVEAWVELEVRLYEELAGAPGQDHGHWTASYTQSGAWRLRRSGSGRRASYTIRPEGLLLPSALAELEGAAYEVCYDDAGETWRTDWEGPVEAQPVRLNSSNESGELALWSTVPEVWMQHPGHDAIPSGSPCRTVDAPRRERLSLDAERLRAAGATLDGNGAVRLAAFTWEELAAAAQGTGPEATFSIRHDTAAGQRRVEIEIRGSIGERRD